MIGTVVNVAALAELAALGLQTIALDLRDPASIAAAVLVAGPVNVLFNCTGFVASGGISDCVAVSVCTAVSRCRSVSAQAFIHVSTDPI